MDASRTPHPSRRSPRRNGFTLIELLVVISIIAILAGLLIPTITMVRNIANQAGDGNDMRQVLTSALVYQQGNDGQWPAVYVAADGGVTDRAGADPKATAIASMELLVFETGHELPNQVFRSRGMPTFMPRDVAGDIRDTGTSTWAAAAAADDANTPGYAYDWAVPATASSQRPVIAHRGHGIWDGTIVAAFGDGHTDKLTARRDTPSTGGSYQLDDLVEPSVKAWVARNPMNADATPDNIFDDEGDDGFSDAIGRGSKTRTALK